MRLLFDLGHPAHVHLFRNLIHQTCAQGGAVLTATREKDVTTGLCSAYNLPQVVLTKAYSGNKLSGILELSIRTLKLLRTAYLFKPDALLGTSLSIGVVGKIIKRPSFVFNEDDASVVPFFARIAYPTCSYIVTPDCLKHENYGSKHLTYPGYHELAYLHPDHFTPDPEVPQSIGLDVNKPYFILRFVSLKAHHDTHEGGLPVEVARELIDMLSEKGRVLITAEGELLEEFRQYQFHLSPEKLHDVLAFASMCIGDSQTVTMESAILGVPNLRCNTFVGRITCLEDIDKVHGLSRGFRPDETDQLIATARQWLGDLEGLKHDFQQRRKVMLEKSVNLTDWLWSMLHEKLAIEPVEPEIPSTNMKGKNEQYEVKRDS